MKYFTIYIEGYKIELFNSILGKETVKVNNRIESIKYSVFGTEHSFKIKEDESTQRFKLITGYGPGGVAIDLYKNENLIIQSNKNFGFVLIFIIVYFIIIFKFLDGFYF